MPARLITDLPDAFRATEHSVGSLGKQLAALDNKAIPTPTTVIIPQDTLHTVIEEIGLLRELRELQERIDVHDNLARYHLKEYTLNQLRTIALPDWLSQEILDAYHRYLHRGFVKIRHGRIDSKLDTSRFEHVQGDANLIESLRHFWGKMVEYELTKHPSLKADTLAPSAIILQAQTQAEASGIAHTVHPETGLRQHFFIKAIWGCPDTQLLEEQADTYTIDNRSHNVIMRSVGTQTRYYRRKQDGLESIPIPAEHQNKPILPDELCSELSRILLRLKRQYLHHAEVRWELTPSGYEITEYQPFHATHERKSTQNNTRITSIYITGGNPNKTKLDPVHMSDGIGILRSEYTYLAFGIHPLAAIKSKQRATLQQKLVSSIKTFHSAVQNKPVLYRSLFATTHQLRHLQYAAAEEPSEASPFLGWRGALRLRHQPQLLTFELEMLGDALHQIDSTLGYVIPFVRHPQELDTIVQAIAEAGLQRYKHFQTWWQLNTPENMLAINSYPTHQLEGVIIHHKTIQAMLHGIDPDNPEISERYSFDHTVFLEVLEQTMRQVKQLDTLREGKQPLRVLLYLEDFNRDLVTAAVKLRLDGVIVKPIALAITHETVAEYERTHIDLLEYQVSSKE